MKQVIVAVRDSAADVFGRPFFVPTAASGIRSFTDEVNRASDDNQFYKHPKDFALYEIGVYDDQTAMIETHPQPKLLINADQCISK
ncbi:nonstructural protein [Microviridae sp.]|nr:nonstructural protein [Microviridae sp.]